MAALAAEDLYTGEQLAAGAEFLSKGHMQAFGN